MFDHARRVSLILVAAVLAGCAGQNNAQLTPAPGSAGLILGTVSYRERIALPPDAVATVWLNDVTPESLAAPIVAEVKIPALGKQVPLPFELPYPRARIESGHYYALRADIRDKDGRELFASENPHPIDFPVPPSAITLWLKQVPAKKADEAVSLVGTSWRLEDLAGAGVVANAPATLEFLDGGRIAGRGSCNKFFGTVKTSGTDLELGPIGATKMACTDPAIGAQEAKYFQALEGARRFEVQGSMLLLYTKGTDTPLRFISAPASGTAP